MTEAEAEELRAAYEAAGAAREQLSALSSALNDGIDEIEKTIKGLRFGVAARIPLDDNKHWLGWGKADSAWRLLHIFNVTPKSEDITPLINAPRFVRMAAIKKLPELLRVLIGNVGAELGQVQQRVADLHRMNEALKKLTPAQEPKP